MKPIDEQFPDRNYPLGEICEYPVDKDDTNAINRMTNAEKKQKKTTSLSMLRSEDSFITEVEGPGSELSIFIDFIVKKLGFSSVIRWLFLNSCNCTSVFFQKF